MDAADPAAACEEAIAVVNDCSAWRAHDDVGPTYVDAIAEGEDVDPWLHGARSQLPIPAHYTERAVTGSYQLTRAADMRRIIAALVSQVSDRGVVCATPDQMVAMRDKAVTLLEDIAREDAIRRTGEILDDIMLEMPKPQSPGDE